MTSPRHLILAAAAAALSTLAHAQTTPPPREPSNVGVSPTEADTAMDKAVPRSDTATVIQTDESAADKARDAAAAVRETAGETRDRAADAVRRDEDAARGDGNRPMRAPRADRN